ncbi:hypothetical protein NDA11_005997 [Ustilago hordei]|uniref:Uncharacterized protein n=1 Tax=Ustilago hordei TaxID=120017 RepID=I2G0B0_USTHO|nr:hypothetical protein NDA15_007006 [Ustilago hordei]KAJ1580575.1 hypothetical protein NDA12_002059 [Ustilago hordei]KAJ1581577.1 hypothetical protein NDA11_005997 [Ustilago hordei]KAJ1595011.1 hypothetical protein NDA14_007566 [Ustilago hordei]CCF52603.1 uncharacterized protein UHOR_04727 [Ustilago hordei]
MVKREIIGSSKQDVEGDNEGVEAHQQFSAMSMGADAVLNATTGMHQNGESPEGDAGDSTDSRAIGGKRQRHDDMREETSTAIDRRPLTVKWFNDIIRSTTLQFGSLTGAGKTSPAGRPRKTFSMKAGLQAETRPRVKIDKQVQTDPPTQTEQKVQADQQVQTEEQGRSGEQPKPGTQAQLEV